MSNIDTKTIGSWLIAILLSAITAFTTISAKSSEYEEAQNKRVADIEKKQEIQDVRMQIYEKRQSEILDAVKETNSAVKETNSTVTDIKIQLSQKKDK